MLKTKQEINKLAMGMAECSTAVKRKVGAVIVMAAKDSMFEMLSSDYNHVRYNRKEACEDAQGNTKSTVLHAEVAAIEGYVACLEYAANLDNIIMFVTNEPCDACIQAMKDVGILDWIVVESFMKHDDGKLDLTVVPSQAKIALAKMDKTRRDVLLRVIMTDLIPTSLLSEMQDILEAGAKKYKKDNWRKIKDTSRYIKALERHYDAGYKLGEWRDNESKYTHLGHVIANAAFLLELEGKDNE